MIILVEFETNLKIQSKKRYLIQVYCILQIKVFKYTEPQSIRSISLHTQWHHI